MIFLVFALLLYTAAILIGASASRNANTNLVSGIINAIAAIIPLTAAIPVISRKTIVTHKYGILMAVLGGVMIAFFTMSLNKAFTENKVGVATPVVFGGAIFLSTILSYFFFKERLSMLELVGLVLLGLGLVVIIYARAIIKVDPI